jgi:uncharacterized protein (TIGR04255 family)
MADRAHLARITFRKPPVDETVLSMQFAALTAFQNQHIGLFWSLVRERYPKVSAQAPIVPAFETFGVMPQRILPTLSLQEVPDVARYWFESEHERDLLQVQQDRLIRNWRRRAPTDDYPRYEWVRDGLHEDLDAFERFLRSENLGELKPNQCEVTYVNLVDAFDGTRTRRLADIMTLASERTTRRPAGDLEDCTLRARFVLKRESEPYGRVYLSCSPAIRHADQGLVFKIELTGRARPNGETIDAAFEMFETLHTAVVQTFAAVTTEEMHRVWELQNG